MNPFLADEYDTLNNIRGLMLLRSKGNEKVAGVIDAFLMRHGIGPGQGSVWQQMLFPMLSQASTWTLRDSTANIPSYLNQFRQLQKGPQVFNDALSGLKSLATGGAVSQQVTIPGLGTIGPIGG